MSVFEEVYECHTLPEELRSTSYLNISRAGNNIIMPPSALTKLVTYKTPQPWLFEMYNPSSSRYSHCGVLEFTADEGCVWMPKWMITNLGFDEEKTHVPGQRQIVRIKFVLLPTHGNSLKIQLCGGKNSVMMDRKVFQTRLKNFSCLSLGDRFMIMGDDGKESYYNVVGIGCGHVVSFIGRHGRRLAFDFPGLSENDYDDDNKVVEKKKNEKPLWARFCFRV